VTTDPNAMVPFDRSALPATILGGAPPEVGDELAGGVQPGFAVLSIRGRNWRIKYKGQEQVITDPNSRMPVSYIDVVMLRANPRISKIYYPDAYADGDDGAPTCWSIDGIRPDPTAAQKQAELCEACPHAVWGSKVTPQGNKTKACSDNRRVAVVPAADIRNEFYGGAMLLRVPAASLAPLAEYSQRLQALNIPFYGVVTRVYFEPEAAYPKLAFQALRPLNEVEARQMMEQRNGLVAAQIIEGQRSAVAPVAPPHAAMPAPAFQPQQAVPQPQPMTTTPGGAVPGAPQPAQWGQPQQPQQPVQQPAQWGQPQPMTTTPGGAVPGAPQAVQQPAQQPVQQAEAPKPKRGRGRPAAQPQASAPVAQPQVTVAPVPTPPAQGVAAPVPGQAVDPFAVPAFLDRRQAAPQATPPAQQATPPAQQVPPAMEEELAGILNGLGQ
jgi:hypothetical protein